MATGRDAARMARALALAEMGWGQTSPNPMVGAVIYDADEKIGEGYHARAGLPHAEIVALQAAGDRARGATMYVTLEPCSHRGRTGPCTEAILAAGVKQVVAAMRDPNPAAGGGAGRLRAAGVTVEFGVCEDDARELNAPFLHSFTSDTPWVTLKLAISLDGAIAGAGRARWQLTNEQSGEAVQRMRSGSDAIAVGVETAIADDPQLTARTTPAPRIAPTRVVFDRTARLLASSVLARTAAHVPTWLVTASTTRLPADLERCGVEQLVAHDLGEALRKLRERGIRSLLVEGGAGLGASLLAGGFVNRLVIFRAPVILGAGALGAFSGIAAQDLTHGPELHVLQTRRLGDDIMTVYSVGKQ